MATNFPTSLDSLTNPTATSTLSSPSHSAQHADANDAIEALEAKVGVNNSAVTTSLDYRVRNPELVGGGARPLLTGGAYIDGTNGLVLSGLSGNYASTPDSAALSITGDIDIKVKFTGGGWAINPPGTQVLVNKSRSSGQGSYHLTLNSSSLLVFTHSADGTTFVSTLSTTGTSVFRDAGTYWARATMDADDGSGNHVVKFYLSSDGTTWNQMGSTVTTAGTTSIYDSTSVLSFGDGTGITGTVPSGTIGRVIIQSAFDTADNTTSVVFDADFAAEAADTLAFTEDSSNAATVSVTTTRYTYGIPGAQLNTAASGLSGSANSAFFNPFIVTDSIDVDMMYFEVTGGVAATPSVRAAIYECDNDFVSQGAAVVNFGDVVIPTSATGVFRKQITPVTLKPGAYMLAWVTNNSSLGFRFYRGGISGAHGAGGSNPLINGMNATANLTSFPQSGLVPTAYNFSNVSPFVMVLLRWKAA